MHPRAKCTRIGGMLPFDRITWNPNQMNGQPCIRGMRLTERRVLEAVALYPNRDDLFRNNPELGPDDVQQALAFAAANLEDMMTTDDGAREITFNEIENEFKETFGYIRQDIAAILN